MKILVVCSICVITFLQFELIYAAKAGRTPSSLEIYSSRHSNLEVTDQTVVRRDLEGTNCSAYTVKRRIKALQCEDGYLAAVDAEIKQSKCRNMNYLFGDDEYEDISAHYSLCKGPRDERESVRICSQSCSERQNQHLICTQLGEELTNIERTCGALPREAEKCWYNKGDFCFLKTNWTQHMLVECFATTPVDSPVLECSARCNRAAVAYKEAIGCCVAYWLDVQYDYSGPTVENIFSTCMVEIPRPCNSMYPPPNEFLDCARDSAGIPAGMVAMVSANIGLLVMTIRVI